MNPDAMLKEALFEAARHLSTPDQRRAYLDRACADDPELRRQIEALLELEAPANEYFGQASSPGPGLGPRPAMTGPAPKTAQARAALATDQLGTPSSANSP